MQPLIKRAERIALVLLVILAVYLTILPSIVEDRQDTIAEAPETSVGPH